MLNLRVILGPSNNNFVLESIREARRNIGHGYVWALDLKFFGITCDQNCIIIFETVIIVLTYLKFYKSALIRLMLN